jgi:hypothetical protein
MVREHLGCKFRQLNKRVFMHLKERRAEGEGMAGLSLACGPGKGDTKGC